jgi:hypothetical protein
MDTTTCPSNISSTIKNISTWNLKTPRDSRGNEGKKRHRSPELQVWSLEILMTERGLACRRLAVLSKAEQKTSKEEFYGQITTP